VFGIVEQRGGTQDGNCREPVSKKLMLDEGKEQGSAAWRLRPYETECGCMREKRKRKRGGMFKRWVLKVD